MKLDHFVEKIQRNKYLPSIWDGHPSGNVSS